MNIFILGEGPRESAIHQIDKHVVKMPLETAQMLSTALWRHAPVHAAKAKVYKAAYKKHPCTVWAGDSMDNFLWLVHHGMHLCAEYTARYGKVHRSEEIIRICGSRCSVIPRGNLTTFAQAMPDQYKSDCAMVAYRKYYMGDKRVFATWKRNKPEWWR